MLLLPGPQTWGGDSGKFGSGMRARGWSVVAEIEEIVEDL